MKIVVLAGGLSPEREVSLSSGSLIANSLLESGHEVSLVDACAPLSKDARRFRAGTGEKYHHEIKEELPDITELLESSKGKAVGDGVIELCREADAVFIALHGGAGENGEVQAILEKEGIPFTGSGSAACAAAMDKNASKEIFRKNGILTAPWTLFDTSEPITREPEYPVVVKPLGCGSSAGVSFAENRAELCAALEKAGKYEKLALAERKISGREMSVGVLCGRALPEIEIIPKSGFYDYKNKYQPGMTEEHTPARNLDEKIRLGLAEAALKVHNALGLGTYSRSDFIVENGTGAIYCLEANTLPGMTPSSLLPQEAAAVGIGYSRLCEIIVGNTVKSNE